MTKVVSTLFLLFLALNCFKELGSEAQQLDAKEVKALEAISDKLKKRDWNFSVDPCSKTSSWVRKTEPKSTYTNNVSCNCNSSSTVCHVVSVELKGQNLAGVLPEEFANLTFLTNLDLTRNYLNGSIPATWASLPLVNLSLLGNRISGRIPEELGNIKTLKKLVIENNEIEGPLPPKLGDLISLEELVLRNCSISDKIPLYIGNWEDLKLLYLTNNSLTGKIPPWILISSRNFDLSYNNFNGPVPTDCEDENLNLVASFSSTEKDSDAPCLRRNYPCHGKAKELQVIHKLRWRETDID